MTELEKIDILRERAGVSYRRAKELLDQCGGDVVEALIRLEEESRRNTWQERIQVQGAELVDRVRQLINEGNVRRIVIRNQDGQTLVELPVTVGALGALLAPMLAVVGVIAALVTRATIVVERRNDGGARGGTGTGDAGGKDDASGGWGATGDAGPGGPQDTGPRH
ncbi:hypothetical protein Tmar_2164 [Thermaerobacter marianensis DSM 12885]|uniref:DUF4342 domain-containing protein n=1 Tax=Thermaerobacter marianensis (strain ATCC 700841 / DSM 12885 / JCM 10246 / 7p75a) TaxID=644966 RepID=E6SK86_THEM7|nr:DUF4342 domain-containing protein [Thermaerobacter marianensis]ADU52244.1 hypothetical protein Tmar_2164 [Thermaerobacter marianensis DSM 12885]